jgi:hypothetical protein
MGSSAQLPLESPGPLGAFTIAIVVACGVASWPWPSVAVECQSRL